MPLFAPISAYSIPESGSVQPQRLFVLDAENCATGTNARRSMFDQG
jgi:hypothetical protein